MVSQIIDPSISDPDEGLQSTDPRHLHRATVMQQLFAHSFGTDLSEEAGEAQEIVAEIPQIDAILQQAAPERPLAEIAKVDLAIMRLIVFESNHKKTPLKVLIDEAVELAKEFGTESSPRFVNGVLAKVLPELAEQRSSAHTLEQESNTEEVNQVAGATSS